MDRGAYDRGGETMQGVALITMLHIALAATLVSLPCRAQTQPEKPAYVGVAVVELFTSEG
jgi:hypothetical protein